MRLNYPVNDINSKRSTSIKTNLPTPDSAKTVQDFQNGMRLVAEATMTLPLNFAHSPSNKLVLKQLFMTVFLTYT